MGKKIERPIALEKLNWWCKELWKKLSFWPRTKCKNEICLLRQALSSKMCSQIFCSPFTEPSALAFPWHHFQPKNYSAEITLTLYFKKTRVFPFFRWHCPSSIFDVVEYARRKVILELICAKYRGISNNVGSTCNPSSGRYFPIDNRYL